MAGGEASLLLRIKTAGEEALKKAEESFDSLKTAAIGAFAIISAVVVKSIADYRQSEVATNALTQSMVNNGIYSKQLKNDYLDQANALAKLSLYQDEEIVSAQASLQSMIGQKKITPELTTAIMDLATAKKMDLNSAAELVGKTIAGNTNVLKRQIVRYLGIFLESSAKPIPIGRYDVNAPAGTADDLLDILKKFQVKTAIVLPKEIEVDFLEAKSNGEAFHKAINIFNMFIGRSLFVPDLLGMSGSETSGGSLALGKEQMNIFFMHINRRRATLEKIVQNHFIKPMCLYNYGDIKAPKFKLNPLDDAAAVELAKVWLDLVRAKVTKPNEDEVNHFRKLVKFPEGDVELIEPAPAFGQPAVGKQIEPEDDKTVPAGKAPNEEIEKEDEDVEPEDESKNEKSFAKIYNLPNGSYHKKVNFKAIENKLNDYDTSLMNEAAPVVKKMFSDLYEQLKRKIF